MTTLINEEIRSSSDFIKKLAAEKGLPCIEVYVKEVEPENLQGLPLRKVNEPSLQ